MKSILEVWEVVKANGLQVHHDGFKPTKSLEWHSAIIFTFHEIEASIYIFFSFLFFKTWNLIPFVTRTQSTSNEHVLIVYR